MTGTGPLPSTTIGLEIPAAQRPGDWPGVRAVVFDFVGTLACPCPPAAEVYRLAAAVQGCELPAEAVEARFRAAFLRQETADREVHGLRTGRDRERNRWRSIVGD